MTTPKKITTPKILSYKGKKKVAMITAYDATFARLVDDAGADMVLVGDSLGMVIQGHENTIPVTLDEVIYHCRAVSRGLRRAHLCGDMPFMSYKISEEQALTSAAKMMRDGRVESVKIEGGREMASTIRRLTEAGVPVVGHVGLLPQSLHAVGGFKMQGKRPAAQEKILEDAKAVSDAGAFCMVLESMPVTLAQEITRTVPVPTIGIGAGPKCDGQVLVLYDMLGMNEGFAPKFLKTYADMATTVKSAVRGYCAEVREGVFPSCEHSFAAAETTEDQPMYGGVSGVEKGSL